MLLKTVSKPLRYNKNSQQALLHFTVISFFNKLGDVLIVNSFE